MKVSIVVPTCRRNELLSRCLDCLFAQNFPKEQYEIIIADDGCEETTRQVVADKQLKDQRVSVKYVPVILSHGPAAARNWAWRKARGEIIAFTDDDCLPDTDWLRKGIEAFTPETIGVWGKITMPLSQRPSDYELNAASLAKAEFVTANCFCRRNALEEIGGFDERFVKAWREDADLFYTLLERYPGQIEHAAAAVVVHPIRRAFFGVSIKQQENNLFEALLFKKHPELYREKVHSPLRPVYYWNVFSLAAMLIGWFQEFWVIFALGVVVWLASVAIFLGYRLRMMHLSVPHLFEMIVTSIAIPPVSIFWRLAGAVKYRVLFY